MHILASILRSKDNQGMKLDQLIDYNMRNIFLEKSYIKCGGETIPISFSKNSKMSRCLDQSCELLKYIETKLQTTCFLPLIKLFLK